MRYFDDIEVGKQVQAGPYEVSEAEIIEFATRWDPRPYHESRARPPSEAAQRPPGIRQPAASTRNTGICSAIVSNSESGASLSTAMCGRAPGARCK